MRPLLLLFVMLSFPALGDTWICDQIDQPKMKGATYFESERPLLINKIAYFNSQGDLITTHQVLFISETSICGAALDFWQDCQVEQVRSKDSYHFSFTCTDHKLTGGFYVDHQGLGRFRCQSPSQSQSAIAGNCERGF